MQILTNQLRIVSPTERLRAFWTILKKIFPKLPQLLIKNCDLIKWFNCVVPTATTKTIPATA